ncbi:MAG: tRNA (N(6)-L-threonylcarbamoyladenosine(37)-C(2))-methylthiotransferase MtaB [Sphingomonadales bacterium]
MSRQEIITFGCRLNSFESEVIRDNLGAAGLEDVVVVNTCAVTAEAERQARQAIRKARRARPDVPIIVTGCAAQLAPEKFADMPEVDRVLGNVEKLKAQSFELGADQKILVNDIMSVRDTAAHLIEGFDGRARAFVQVQNGCDHRCTFCIIPFARGNSRSVPMGAVVRQVERLVENGCREVVLSGVDITAYGADLPGAPGLGSLCDKILDGVPGLSRLRLSSLDPVDIDDRLLELIAGERRVMPHLHLSAQAGDDMVLKRMKRRHLRADLVSLCGTLRARRPDIVFGADLIAGFPTESEAMFQNTLALVEDCGLTFLHVFPYSARPGTPAARMPQLPVPVRKERAARLRGAGAEALARFLDFQIGRTVEVLVEKCEQGRAFGHSEQFAPVWIEQPVSAHTTIEARVTGVQGQQLEGMIAS